MHSRDTAAPLSNSKALHTSSGETADRQRPVPAPQSQLQQPPTLVPQLKPQATRPEAIHPELVVGSLVSLAVSLGREVEDKSGQQDLLDSLEALQGHLGEPLIPLPAPCSRVEPGVASASPGAEAVTAGQLWLMGFLGGLAGAVAMVSPNVRRRPGGGP